MGNDIKAVTIYVTKYWQTRGIVKRKATPTTNSRLRRTASGQYFYMGSEAFYEEQDALNHVNLRLDKALTSAKKKIAKLERIKRKGIKIRQDGQSPDAGKE